jgi:hypothetical protein
MNQTPPTPVRKRLISEVPTVQADALTPAGALDLAACATIGYTSEEPAHPIENLFDAHNGPGGSYWSSARVDKAEELVVEFETAQSLSRLVYEVEEQQSQRTQEVHVEVSQDGGRTYRRILVQEYTFSPRGATFQKEDLKLHESGVTQLRLTIIPNKSGSGKATLTLLRLYS